MMPAANSGVGGNVGFPDPCATPPLGAPIPYPNIAMNAMAVPFVPNVQVSFVPALNMISIVPLTMGDQAGCMSPFMGPGMETMGNPIVYVDAIPGSNLLNPTSGNNMINGLGAKVIPSITNVFYTRAGAPPSGEIDAAGIAALQDATRAGTELEAESLLDGDVMYLRIPAFAIGLASRIHDALRRLAPAALILDLRGCPGGDLDAAVELASDFLPEGALIATLVDGDGDETALRSRNEHPHELPVVLLVDRATASAAEVLAGSLQAHRRAVVVGEPTYGKGTAQALLAGDSAPGARYLTVASVLLPDGEPLDGRGVSPDVRFTAPADDPAVAAALAATGQ